MTGSAGQGSNRRAFGFTPDGAAIEALTIAGGELSAEILTWGAVLRDLRLAGISYPLVLGFDRLEDYLAHSPFFGATAGRYANRIAEGRFVLDGQTIQLDRNCPGGHHLHGGAASFATRPWSIAALSDRAASFLLVSEHGESGYPGTVTVTCDIEIAEPATLRFTYTGTTDAPTVLNLAHHSYFNLDNADSILNHVLRIDAQSYLPVDETLIPTGEIAAVAGTPFDFRAGRRIGETGGPDGALYDHNYCLSRQPVAAPRLAACLSGQGGVAMQVWTTEPGLQFYDGAKVDVPVPGSDGRRYGRHAGLCLEPQRWPDSPNRPQFTDATLRTGETYRQITEFRFSRI